MKKLIYLTLSIALVLVVAASAMAQDSCIRHVEAQGGFSVCLPSGWIPTQKEDTDDSGQKHPAKYKILYSPVVAQFRPNINFKDEASSASLEDYVAAGIDVVLGSQEKLGTTNMRVVTQGSFVTSSGLYGMRVAFHFNYKGYTVRSVQYYFNDAASRRKFVITGTGQEQDQATLDSIFDLTARSFRFERVTLHH
jgi:hypothetical protein